MDKRQDVQGVEALRRQMTVAAPSGRSQPVIWPTRTLLAGEATGLECDRRRRDCQWWQSSLGRANLVCMATAMHSPAAETDFVIADTTARLRSLAVVLAVADRAVIVTSVGGTANDRACERVRGLKDTGSGCASLGFFPGAHSLGLPEPLGRQCA